MAERPHITALGRDECDARFAAGYSGAVRELVAGDHFAGYLIEGVLGRGGMGVVYRGRRQTALADRAVALKVMRPEHALDERFAARFREEARRAAALEHPSIVPVYDADEWQGVPYIAMRLVVGRDLASLIETRGPQPPEVVLRIAADVAGALDAAHAAGVVHRDVKPRQHPDRRAPDTPT